MVLIFYFHAQSAKKTKSVPWERSSKMEDNKEMTPEAYQETVKEFGQTEVPFSEGDNPRGHII